MARISVDLKTQFPDQWAGLTIGKHTVQIRAKNPGNYLDSDLSTAIDFYKTVPITVTAINCTAASNNPTEFPDVGGDETILTFNKETGYTLPETIVITGVAGQNIGYSWTVADSGTYAELKILKALGNIEVTVTGVAETYSITPALTNCTWDAENATTIASNQFTPIQLIINKNTGWTLPTEISVSGVDAEYWSWNQSTGIVTISHPQGNVTITVNAVREVYNITTNLTHATKESGPSTIAYGGNATLVFSFPTNYEAPADVTVTGVTTKSWEAGTGTLTLMKATGPVAVTVVGVATTTTLDGGTYKWRDNTVLTEWTQEINFTSNGASYTGMRYTGNGTAMTLQYRYGGSDWVTVYNYDEDASTGSWVNDAYKIVDLGTSAQTVTAIFKADFIANTTKLTQLATPQNVTADGTTVSWDAVENATSYAVLADGSEIGTVEAGPETAVGTWLLNTTLIRPTTTQRYNVNFKYPGNTYITANGQIALQSGNYPILRISEYDSEAGEDYAYCYYYTKSGDNYIPSTNGNYYAVIYTSNIYYTVTTEARIIQITGGADIYNSDLIAWLKANATKQS